MSGGSVPDSERAQQLHAAKLKAVVRSALGGGDVGAAELGKITATESGAFGLLLGAGGAGGAGAAGPAAEGVAVAYLAELEPERSLGPALAVAVNASARELHLFAPAELAVLVRRAQLFDFPITVWSVETGTGPGAIRVSRVEAAAERRAPEPTPPRVPELVALLSQAPVEVVVEHGVITAEVAGLEVARIVRADEPTDTNPTFEPTPTIELADPISTTPKRTWRIEVGVGAHDREAFAVLHADEPTLDSVRRVAEMVANHRSPGAEPHPLNRLAPARWLRALLIQKPELVSAVRLQSASPPVARSGVSDTSPAVAFGVDESGQKLIVVCSVGIDLDLVPFAADAREFLDGAARLVLVLPERDRLPLVDQVLDLLSHKSVEGVATQAEVITVENDWNML